MEEEARRLKAKLVAAKDLLAAEPPPEPVNPTADELAAGVDFIFEQHEARYLLEAENEPARIAGWLMARFNGERAIFMDDAKDWIPILGTVNAAQEQRIMRVVADSKTVALINLSMDEQIGELISSPEMVAALRHADLPVWGHLLTD